MIHEAPLVVSGTKQKIIFINTKLGSQSMPTFFLDASKGTIGHQLGVFVHVRENFAEWNVV